MEQIACIAAVSERARCIIAENQVVQLSLRDQKILADAFADKDTREPDTYLENLATRYRDTVKSE